MAESKFGSYSQVKLWIDPKQIATGISLNYTKFLEFYISSPLKSTKRKIRIVYFEKLMIKITCGNSIQLQLRIT